MWRSDSLLYHGHFHHLRNLYKLSGALPCSPFRAVQLLRLYDPSGVLVEPSPFAASLHSMTRLVCSLRGYSFVFSVYMFLLICQSLDLADEIWCICIISVESS